LLSHGAPPDLVAGAHRAALDEIEHARMAYSFASRRSRPFGPGPLRVVTHARDRASLARETFADGCIGETIAALQARSLAASTTDRVVRRALLRIARDEERHAELAWRILAWMLRSDPSVRDAIRDVAFVAKSPDETIAMRDVITPCACALFEAA
jgi:hypothetical protein